MLRLYVATPPAAALVVIGVAAARTDWRARDLAEFLLLACCGMISVASTPRLMYRVGGAARDFSTIWVLPAAIVLPPIYAALIPIPIIAVIQFWVYRGVVYRRIFTASAISLSYATASLVFRSFPYSWAGSDVGVGWHVLTWSLAVAACEVIGGRAHHFLIVGAVKLSDRRVRVRDIEWTRGALEEDFAELDLGVLITIAVALSPALVILAVPTVLLVRRFLLHPVLVAQSRLDAKTGLLNVSTWEREAESELSRAIRARSSLALLLVDIDHFKLVNDSYGHLVGDRVLRALADAFRGQLRDYDKAGRFGGEEFVILLAQTSEDDARRIAERLRAHVGGMAVPVDDSPNAQVVRLTISIGVTAMEGGRNRELTDLLAAADSALYHAKQTGRNKVALARPSHGQELEVVLDGHAGVVEVDPAGASLGLSTSL